MIASEGVHESESRVYLATPITLFQGENATTAVMSQGLLGVARGTDPVTGLRRKLWGLADSRRSHLSQMRYAISTHTDPAGILAMLRKQDEERFTFHSGMPLWTTLEELGRALEDLGLAAPERYRGVLVPESLIGNWGQVEAGWWRRGVDQAAEELSRQAEELLR